MRLISYYITVVPFNPYAILCKVFFDIVDSRISSYKLCQILEKRNVLANPRSLKRWSSILFDVQYFFNKNNQDKKKVKFQWAFRI